MADYTKRLQILLTEEQHDFIKTTAAEQRISVGELIRSAVEEKYRPRIALRRLSALRALAEYECFDWQSAHFLASEK